MSEFLRRQLHFRSAPCCELNRCEESTLFTQQEVDGAEKLRLETTDRGGETSDQPAALHHCSRRNTLIQINQMTNVLLKLFTTLESMCVTVEQGFPPWPGV